MSKRTDDLLAAMTTEEKVAMVTGGDMWHTRGVERLGIPKLKVTDGPNGARGDGLMGTGSRTACIPSGAALGATWDPALVAELGELLGDEAIAKRSQVLLAPTINLHRSPKGGRNFECYSEDPILSGRLAAAFVRGVQSRGVATTAKHFVGNDSEFERNSIDTQVDERTLRELYLVPFEHAVKDGGSWGIMSAYNRLNGTFCSENHWLLTTVLREEWGFDGFVVTDWFAARSTADMANAGLSLEMPGEGRWYGELLTAAVNAGEVHPDALDRIAGDVLALMERTGALDHDNDFTETELDRPEDRALVRRAAAAGSVLLRNDGVLPLHPEAITKVAVIGPNAFNAKVMGGGSAKVNAYRATSPLDALSARLPHAEVVWEKGCDIDRTCPALTKPLVQGRVTVEYFDGFDLDHPAKTTVQTGSFDFMAFGEPASGVSAESYSLRATATIVPTSTATHEFRLVQCGRARVLVDGEVVLDATDGDYPRGSAFFGFGTDEIVAQVDLIEGQEIEVTAEFSNRDSMLLSGMKLGLLSTAQEDLLGRAVALAADSDVAVVVVGTNDDWETEGRDRDLWELPGDQPELIRRVAAANERTIVILNVGSPHDLSWLDEPAAVLSVGFGGQELGDAIVDMLLGEVEPSGRAPTTVGDRYEHFGAYLNYPGENSVVRYGEGLFTGHRFHDSLGIEPAVAFGFGLSYTTFELSEPRIASGAGAPTGATITVEVDVANTGERRGSEVVQVYVEPLNPEILRPVRELKAFQKVTLDPGETTTVVLDLEPRSFAYYDVGDPFWAELSNAGPVPVEGEGLHRTEAGWYVDPGDYRIVSGRSSRSFSGSVMLTLTGDATRLDT
ncbi:MAG: beta-glucosidase [Acidimicrobiaceae bacterium]|nr:beta-glucosidase [Acidimicrobiaceae bacterium]MXW75748.1 beta-glucosidase [Acidimicrobiaceae bacterium]MYA73252.1 beta-glucosidase [Acidimicrobiaceae bacterium]MYC43032.1 beta-glucosidase [Acidimicrobiaceae bacterium]MYD07348.1 beta-glucosidase [Acidimicrobiaceae bacterium]